MSAMLPSRSYGETETGGQVPHSSVHHSEMEKLGHQDTPRGIQTKGAFPEHVRMQLRSARAWRRKIRSGPEIAVQVIRTSRACRRACRRLVASNTSMRPIGRHQPPKASVLRGSWGHVQRYIRNVIGIPSKIPDMLDSTPVIIYHHLPTGFLNSALKDMINIDQWNMRW